MGVVEPRVLILPLDTYQNLISASSSPTPRRTPTTPKKFRRINRESDGATKWRQGFRQEANNTTAFFGVQEGESRGVTNKIAQYRFRRFEELFEIEITESPNTDLLRRFEELFEIEITESPNTDHLRSGNKVEKLFEIEVTESPNTDHFRRFEELFEIEITDSPNTDHHRFGNKVEELFEMEQFKRTLGAFDEISNNLLTMARKNAELNKELSEAKLAAESALKKSKDSEIRAVMAEKAEKAMAIKNAELSREVEVVKKEAEKTRKVLEYLEKYFNDYLNENAEELINKAEKAGEALEDWKKSYIDLSKKSLKDLNQSLQILG